MATTIKQAIETFLGALELIEDKHKELTDTDVREALHRSVNEFVVWGRINNRTPSTFGMFSAKGDLLVADAIRGFLNVIAENNLLKDVPVGQARLDALQGAGAKSPAGVEYDEYLGHRDTPLTEPGLPSAFFELGDYED